MRKNLFYVLSIIALAITNTSCEKFWENGSNNTPQIQVADPFIVEGADTTKLGFFVNKNDWYLDTISMGDTVQFIFGFTGYPNNLTKLQIDHDANYGKIIFIESERLDSVFDASKSDYSKGRFILKGECQGLSFPFRYYPTKENNREGEISVRIESDADLDNNAQYLEFKIPVFPKK